MLSNRWWIAPLEKPWANIVGKYSVFVARHPWPFIVLPLLLTAVLSTGIIFEFKIVRGVRYLYAPLNADWKREEAVLADNWAADDQHFYPGKDITRRRGLYLILNAKPGENILSQKHSRTVLEILNWVESVNITTESGLNFSYRDICLQFQNQCFTNSHAKLIADVFAHQHENTFNITYPIFRTQFATEPIDLSKALGNVTTHSNGHLKSATAWMLLYQLKQHEKGMNLLSSRFEDGITALIKDDVIPRGELDVFYFHSETFDRELARETERIKPMFSVTFTTLIIFSILCTFTIRWVNSPFQVNSFPGKETGKLPAVDWVLSKPWMGVVGVMSTLMAIISSTGLLLLFGVQFVDMCTVMPFLSLTIGIDDTFLMLAAWHDTDRRDSVEKRIETAMRHAAVSISITSLTDAIAFLIGAIAPLPAVMYFCYYSSAAICFIYLYCTTFFTAFLALQARWEHESRNCLLGSKTKDFDHMEKLTTSQFVFGLGSRPHTTGEDLENVEIDSNNNNNTDKTNSDSLSENKSEEKDLNKTLSAVYQKEKKPTRDGRMWYQRFFEDLYGPLIIRKLSTVFAVFLFAGYVVVAFLGSQRLIVGFDLINIVQKDSLPWKFLDTRKSMFPEDLSIMDIAVLNPPNIARTEEREAFFKVLEEYENTFCSFGRNSTLFWFFAYEAYLNDLGFGFTWDDLQADEDNFSENMRNFLMTNEKWDYDVIHFPENRTIRAFRLSTRLTNLPDDEHTFKCAQEMRAISSRHPNYSLSTYAPVWNIADEYDIMWPQTMQDIYISIIVMVPVSLLFIPQPLCAVAISFNIASIALGTIGFMAWWDVNLDATSMITIAMSVGFSVDFAAHVSYAYMTEKVDAKTPGKCAAERRLCRTLGTVGWPVTQASFSVLLGVSSLYAVDSYIVQTCFKTVVLVIVFGTIHALLFLPLALMYVHKLYLFFIKSKRDSDSESGDSKI